MYVYYIPRTAHKPQFHCIFELKQAYFANFVTIDPVYNSDIHVKQVRKLC